MRHTAREAGGIFQSTPPVKAATRTEFQIEEKPQFQSTPPVKAATIIHMLLILMGLFQSTPPVKAATSALDFLASCINNFNPRRP